MKPKVLITRKIFKEALDYLEDHVDYEIGTQERELKKQDLREKVKDKQGILSLLVDTIDKDVMDAAPQLRIIANCAVGYDNIDTDYARKRGILVTNTPGVLTETTADLTWALILSTARRIPQADVFTRAKNYKGWELDLYLGREVTGKCLGIIGMGRIGKAVASRARAFRMKVMYYDPHRLPEEEEERYQASWAPLEDLLRVSDIVTLHASLTPETTHMISAERLQMMKKEAILVNVSRGPVVDEKALAEALAKRFIWAAGLDVYEKEPEVEDQLLSLDNVVLLPHIGSATFETRIRMATMAAKNLVQGLSGQQPDNLVA
ncbi:MAG: D-glycerate dehydrogenase [Candidatus Aminicenantes bacterium]|nr:MAG: D-glycerate dehydrogenase [Candidatus Aminicenantes bacterium]